MVSVVKHNGNMLKKYVDCVNNFEMFIALKAVLYSHDFGAVPHMKVIYNFVGIMIYWYIMVYWYIPEMVFYFKIHSLMLYYIFIY